MVWRLICRRKWCMLLPNHKEPVRDRGKFYSSRFLIQLRISLPISFEYSSPWILQLWQQELHTRWPFFPWDPIHFNLSSFPLGNKTFRISRIVYSLPDGHIIESFQDPLIKSSYAMSRERMQYRQVVYWTKVISIAFFRSCGKPYILRN